MRERLRMMQGSIGREGARERERRWWRARVGEEAEGEPDESVSVAQGEERQPEVSGGY